MSNIGNGRWYKTKNIALVASQPGNDFDLPAAIGSAIAGARSPVIADFIMRIRYSGTTAVSGGASGMSAWGICKQLTLADRYGLRVFAKGSTLANKAQEMLGSGIGFFDPPNSGASATITNRVINLPLPFGSGHKKAIRHEDFRLMAADFAYGGQLLVDFSSFSVGPGTTNALTVTSGDMEFWLYILDEGANAPDDYIAEAKSRSVLREVVLAATQQAFQLSGPDRVVSLISMQYFVGQVGADKATPDTLSTTEKITSVALGMTSTAAETLRQAYYQRSTIRHPDSVFNSGGTPAASPVVAAEDRVENALVLPIQTPRHNQATSELPRVASLDFLTDTAIPAAADLPTIALHYVEDRPDGSYGGRGSDGHMQTADGHSVPAAGLDEQMVNKLPMKPAGTMMPTHR